MAKRVARFMGVLAVSIVFATVLIVIVELAGLSVVATAE
jgi:hypothetical protein